MKNWKSKLFGDNCMNFYGWIFTGTLIFGLSLWLVAKAMRIGASDSPVCLLLMAICLLLVGLLGIALQNYCARVAKNIEAKEADKQ